MANVTATAANKPSSLDAAITSRVAKLVREMDSLRSALEQATITKMVQRAASHGHELCEAEIRTTMKFDPTGPTAQRFAEIYAVLLGQALAARRPSLH
jgi:hypothetical protein